MQFVKKLIPEVLLKFVRPYYHGFLAWAGSIYFGHPSEKMVVIGVTGTNGKSTTVNLIAKILEGAQAKTGFTSTVTFSTGQGENLNKVKMTMSSGWVLQKWMAKMVENKCKYAVLEVSSEGLAQNRHLGINFDVAVFTNLTPEHIESHGGFENYKLAKGKLFQTINNLPLTIYKKQINSNLKKTIVTNLDSEHAKYYSSFKAEKYVTYSEKNPSDFQAVNISYSPQGVKFLVHDSEFNLHLKGQFDIYNALCAIATTSSLGVSINLCKTALEKVEVIPGRVEVIQAEPFTVVVDYAYEPEEMRQLYETVSRWPHKRVLQVLGPTGGGRDKARIPLLGKMAGEFADLVFITIDDPYDDDPKVLNQQMSQGALGAGKTEGQSLFKSLDRREAIAKAFSFAEDGDLVLITGKGADQKMALANGKYMDWDDRKVAKHELGFLKLNKSKKYIKGW